MRSSSEDDVVDGYEDELDDVPNEADHHEPHGASLQDLHVLYTHTQISKVIIAVSSQIK